MHSPNLLTLLYIRLPNDIATRLPFSRLKQMPVLTLWWLVQKHHNGGKFLVILLVEVAQNGAGKWCLSIQRVPQLFEQLEFFYVNKSCKIECCGNKMHQIVQNVILTWGLELKLSLLWRATLSGQHSLFYRWEKVGEPLLPLYFDGSRGTPAFSHL